MTRPMEERADTYRTHINGQKFYIWWTICTEMKGR